MPLYAPACALPMPAWVGLALCVAYRAVMYIHYVALWSNPDCSMLHNHQQPKLYTMRIRAIQRYPSGKTAFKGVRLLHNNAIFNGKIA